MYIGSVIHDFVANFLLFKKHWGQLEQGATSATSTVTRRVNSAVKWLRRINQRNMN